MNKDITKDKHLPSESTTVQSAHLALSGETKGWKRLLPFLGPLLSRPLLILILATLLQISQLVHNMDIYYYGLYSLLT